MHQNSSLFFFLVEWFVVTNFFLQSMEHFKDGYWFFLVLLTDLPWMLDQGLLILIPISFEKYHNIVICKNL
jgi:hypothetical protein